MYSNAILYERLQLSLFRFVATFVAAMAAVWVRHGLIDGGPFLPLGSYLAPAAIGGVLVVVSLWNVPAKALRRVGAPDALRILWGLSIATAMLLALSFFYRSETYSRATVVLFIVFAGFGVMVADTAHRALLSRMRSNSDATRRALLVGNDEYSRRVARALEQEPAYLEIVGYLDDKPTAASPSGAVPWLGSPRDLNQIVTTERIDTVIIASESASSDEIQHWIGMCMASGANWTFVPPLLGLIVDRIQVDRVGGLPLVSGRGDRLVGHAWFLKRAFDIAVTGLALLIVAPFAAVAAIAIKLNSPGPAIYRQQRIGMDERPFTLLKFRTMTHDADPSDHRDYARNWIYGRTGESTRGSQEVHKLQGDGRITGVGRALRATSFDEVPQLWNVLRGDMSLVGPRPPISYEVEQYTEWHRRRLSVPPGVTGLWQITGRNNVSFDEMVEMDLDYIEDWTLGLDISILIRTVPAVVLHRGR